MRISLLLLLTLFSVLNLPNANAQSGNSLTDYLKSHIIPVEDPMNLTDSVYHQFSSYRLIMVGDMHGTNEPADLALGLARLFSAKGDSVSLGMEIPKDQMTEFLNSGTDSSIYQSKFFNDPLILDGRESFAWANVIRRLKRNPKVEVFFFDINSDEINIGNRDSMMYVKIKKQMLRKPGWKTITLSGNMHAMTSEGERQAGSYLKNDAELKLTERMATISNYYQSGNCYANFGHGLEKREFNREPNEYDTLFPYKKYLIKVRKESPFPYSVIYYTNQITASPQVKGNLDRALIKQQLIAIEERDQRVRKSSDSINFVQQIDSSNLAVVVDLINRYGWMGKSMIGGRSNYIIWLIIQHADIETQHKYLPMLEESVEEGESRPIDLAYLKDRVLMRDGKKQIYGTQVVPLNDGTLAFYPIEDEVHVNNRRSALGMEPIEEYAKNFNIDYKLPSK